jgi:hypothetical protein
MMQNGGGIEGGPVAIKELQGQVKKLQKGKAAAEMALDNLRQTVKATGQPTHVRLSIFDSYIACMMLQHRKSQQCVLCPVLVCCIAFFVQHSLTNCCHVKVSLNT